MIYIRWVALFLAFTLEVRIKAAQQEPTDCLSQKLGPCSVFSFRPSTVNIGHGTLFLSTGSILVRTEANEWHFAAGAIRVATARGLRLKTRVGALILTPGVQWIQWKDHQLWVYSLEGSTDVRLNSTTLKNNLVPQGFMNWYGLVNFQGVNPQGVPRMILADSIQFQLSAIRHHKDLALVAKNESRSIAQAAEFNSELAQHMENQYSERLHEKENRDRQKKINDQRVKQIFREKYFSPVELPEDAGDTSRASESTDSDDRSN